MPMARFIMGGKRMRKTLTKIQKIVLLLLCAIITILVVPSKAFAATNPYPNYNYDGIAGDWKNCTWSVWKLVYEELGITLPNWGNAEDWAENASTTYSIGTTPRENSIVVYKNSGHVAFVTSVSADGTQIYVKEGGYGSYGNYGYHEGWTNASGIRYESQYVYKYIYLTNEESASEDGIWIKDKYYISNLQRSTYQNDTTKYSADNLVITVNANWSETPGFDVENGNIWVRIINNDSSEERYQSYYYYYYYKGFSITIDISDYDDGEYWLLIYPNNGCARDDVYLYKYGDQAYFAGACSDTAHYDRYNILKDKLEQLSPSTVQSNYMNSVEAIRNNALEGQDVYIKAHEIIAGCTTEYECARKVYEWIAYNYNFDQRMEAQDTMVAMLNSLGIPAIKCTNTSYRWIYFYCNEKWHLASPYMALFDNNIGYFDTEEMFAVWDLGSEMADIIYIKPISYSIAFNGNGSTSNSMLSMTNCSYGTSYQLTANEYKRAGYEFTSWNTKADGSGTTYADKASVKNLTTIQNGIVTLYAQWKMQNKVAAPTIKKSGNKVVISAVTEGSTIYYTIDGSTPTVTNGIKVNKSSVSIDTFAGHVKAIAVKDGYVNSDTSKLTLFAADKNRNVSFAVKGVFGGRNVTFNSDLKDAKIYYSSTTSTLTTSDKCVNVGETVLFKDFYGTIYARTYKDGQWGNVCRLILRIPVVNTPTISIDNNGYATIRTTTPSSYLYYTTDGSTPSMTNGRGVSSPYIRVYVGKGKTVKAIAVRSCFTNSGVATKK